MNYLKFSIFCLLFTFLSACEKEEFLTSSPDDDSMALESAPTSKIAEDVFTREGGGRDGDDAWMFFNKGDNTNNVYHATSQNGTNWSGGSLLDDGGHTKESPEAIMFRGNAYVFYRGENLQKKIFFAKRGQFTNWGPQGSMQNGLHILAGPTPVVYNGKIYVFFVDEHSVSNTYGGGIRYFVSSDGNSFGGPYTLSTGTLVDGDAAIKNREVAAVATRGGILYVFYVNNDGRIYAIPCSAASSSDVLTQSTVTINVGDRTKNGLSATTDPRTGDIVYVHTSYSHDNVMERRIGPGGMTNMDLSNEAAQILGARSSRKPSIYSDDDGNLVVVYRGRKSSSIYWSKYLNATGNWFGNVKAAGGHKTSKGPGLVYTGW